VVPKSDGPWRYWRTGGKRLTFEFQQWEVVGGEQFRSPQQDLVVEVLLRW